MRRRRGKGSKKLDNERRKKRRELLHDR